MAEHTPSGTPPVNPNPGWQDKDIKLVGLVIFLVLILVVTAATMWGMMTLFAGYEDRIRAGDVPISPLAVQRTLPEGAPLLQVLPVDELNAHYAEEDAILNHYGWVNREMGVARIPIDRGMDLVLEEGLPTRESTE